MAHRKLKPWLEWQSFGTVLSQPAELFADTQPFERDRDGDAAPVEIVQQEFAIALSGEEDDALNALYMSALRDLWQPLIQLRLDATCPGAALGDSHRVQGMLIGGEQLVGRDEA